MPPAAEDLPVCGECGDRGWILESDGGAGSARLCRCRQVGDPVPALLAAAGIPSRYKNCTLSNFSVTNPDPRCHEQLLAARTIAQRYVEGFFQAEKEQFRESGLLFIGPPGAGKTHLAAAVLAELIRRYRVRGSFVDVTTLIHTIQSTFDPAAVESKQQVLDPVMEAEVLVLDELGAQKPTEWVSDTLYLILNSRYGRRLPTLFTTNFRLDAGPRPSLDQRGPWEEAPLLSSRIPASVLSRLYEMARPVRIEVGDFRREIKAGQHRL